MYNKQKKTEPAQQLLKSTAILMGSMLAVAGASALQAEAVEAASNTKIETGVATAQAFLKQLIPHATDLARENDLYASVMMAQAVLESGWGQSHLARPPYHNLFGIKGNYRGQTVVMPTLEDNGKGNYYPINDGFRAYPSYRESLEDYTNLLRKGLSFNANFYSGAWRSQTSSYRDATAFLTGRYATDTSYGTKLNKIIEEQNLTRYDEPSRGNSASAKPTTPKPAPQKPTNAGKGKSYTVQAGDGLYTVARALGTSVAALKAKYGLTSNLIHPGQVFTLAGGQSTGTASQPAGKPTPKPGSSWTPAGAKSYTVKAGDGLYTVAQALGTSVSALKAKYGLTSNLIHPGQVFTMGGQKTSTSKPTHSQEQPQGSSAKHQASYTVKAGDGLYTVAKALGTDVASLKAKYGLKSNMIHPGQVFTMTGGNVGKAENNLPKMNTAPAATSRGSYTVKPGDGLYTVAQALGTNVAALKAKYGLTSNLIVPGQVFTMAGSQQTKKPATGASGSLTSGKPAEVKTPEDSLTSEHYQVQAGDNFYRIAQKHGVSLEALLSANHVTSNSLLLPGQNLIIPGA